MQNARMVPERQGSDKRGAGAGAFGLDKGIQVKKTAWVCSCSNLLHLLCSSVAECCETSSSKYFCWSMGGIVGREDFFFASPPEDQNCSACILHNKLFVRIVFLH